MTKLAGKAGFDDRMAKLIADRHQERISEALNQYYENKEKIAPALAYPELPTVPDREYPSASPPWSGFGELVPDFSGYRYSKAHGEFAQGLFAGELRMQRRERLQLTIGRTLLVLVLALLMAVAFLVGSARAKTTEEEQPRQRCEAGEPLMCCLVRDSSEVTYPGCEQ